MASGSFTVTTDNQYISGKVSWTSKTDIPNNQSTVTATMTLSRTNSGYTTYGTGNFSVVIDGTTYSSGSKSFTITQNSNTVMVSASKTVTHGSDGSKEITISWSGSIPSIVSVNGSNGKAKLDTIPRASSISSSANWTAGSNLSVTISRATTSFTHDVEVFVDNMTTPLVTKKGVGASTTISFTEAENTTIFTRLAQGTTKTTRVRIQTYSGTTKIGGTVQKDGTVTAPSNSSTSWGGNFNIGATMSGSITRYHSNFRHTIQLIFGGQTYTLHDKTTSTSWTYNTSNIAGGSTGLYSRMPNSNSLVGQIRIYTYYNNVQVRSYAQSNVTASVASNSSNPTLPSTWTFKDNSSVATKTGNSAYYVQNMSNLIVEIPVASRAQATNYATMKTYEAEIAKKKVPANWSDTGVVTINIGKLDISTNQTLTLKAIDSRGNSTTTSKTVNVLPYKPPVVTTSAKRLNNFEEETTFTLKGSFSLLTIGTSNKNALGVTRMRYKSTKTSSWTNIPYINFTKTITGASYTATSLKRDLLRTESYNVEVEVSDSLSTVTVSLTVSTGKPILYIDQKNGVVGVGKLTTDATYALDVEGVIKASDAVTAFNRDNQGASVSLGFTNNIARLRIGGSGAGATNGFNILGTGDSLKLQVSNAGVLTAYGDIYSETTTGWGRFGSRNTTWFHMDTDRASFYMYKPLNVDGLTVRDGATLNGQVRLQGSGTELLFASNDLGRIIGDSNGTYIQHDIEIKATKVRSVTYVPVRASSFPTGSLVEFKQDIELWEDSALNIINNSEIFRYRLVSDVEDGKDRLRYGLVIGEGYSTPNEIIDGDGVEQYAMNSISWKALQELYKKVLLLEERLEENETS